MKQGDADFKSKFGGRGVGDCAGAEHHETHLLILDGESEAQAIVDFFANELPHLPRVRVVFGGERTTRLRGKAFVKDKRILLYPIGRTVGVLIHEYAHFGRRGRWPHGREFQGDQAEMLALWDEKKKTIDELLANLPKRTAIEIATPYIHIPKGKALPTPPPPTPKPPTQYIPEADEVDDLLELIVERAIGCGKANGVVSVTFISTMLKNFGVHSSSNFLLVRELIIESGCRVIAG